MLLLLLLLPRPDIVVPGDEIGRNRGIVTPPGRKRERETLPLRALAVKVSLIIILSAATYFFFLSSGPSRCSFLTIEHGAEEL